MSYDWYCTVHLRFHTEKHNCVCYQEEYFIALKCYYISLLQSIFFSIHINLQEYCIEFVCIAFAV